MTLHRLIFAAVITGYIFRYDISARNCEHIKCLTESCMSHIVQYRLYFFSLKIAPEDQLFVTEGELHSFQRTLEH